MKIAIFGDSFAVSTKVWQPGMITDNKAWPELLKNDYPVDNYAQSGSSISYSLRKLIYYDAFKNYDKVIFLVTYPDRLLITGVNDNDISRMGGYSGDLNLKYTFEGNKERIARYSKRNDAKAKYLVECYKASDLYYQYLHDWDYSELSSFLLIDMLRKNKKAVVVPISNRFNARWKEVLLIEPETGLDSIYEYENKSWNIESSGPNFIDKRICHMTYENNFILYQKMKEWLNGAPVSIDTNNFYKPTMSDKEKYIEYQKS